MTNTVGRRIHVIGNSCTGKSTLAAKLADILDIPLVELDALNWLPNWVGLNEHDPAEFERLIREATAGDAWVVAGSYSSFSLNTFWDRVEAVVWLDLPRPLLVFRVLRRSWRRSRSQELLWGTNRESFWKQLQFWRKEDSLLWWIVTQQNRKRRWMRSAMADEKLGHIRFIHLDSVRRINEFAPSVEDQAESEKDPVDTPELPASGKHR